MADVREAFPMLEDGNLEGKVLRQMIEGDDPASKNGLIGFSFKDADGNVILPQLDNEGKLPVTFDTAGTVLRGRGTVSDKDNTLADLTGADITLGASKTYVDMAFSVSCRRGAYFQLVQVNDASEIVLYDCIVDAGQYSYNISLKNDEITAGASGTQKLKIKCQTFEKASNVYASLTCKEVS